jgi:hemerythrin-like domain-containing protein
VRSVELLLEDHRDIERQLAILAGVVRRLRDAQAVDAGALKRIIDVMLEFNDRYHHAREEQHVFPVLEGYALLTMAGRLDCMPGEHEIGRQLTTRLQEAATRYATGDAAAVDEIVDAGGKYLQLLGHHMGIEEGVLFELAEKVVSDEDDAAMAEALEKIGADYRDSGDLARIRLVLDELQPLAAASVSSSQ